MATWTLDQPRTLTRVCLGTGLWALAFGMMGPAASLWLMDHHFSDAAIGRNMAVYFLGIVLAVAFVPPLMLRRGRLCIVLGMAAVGVTYAGFPWMAAPAALFLIRGLNGVGTAFSLVPLETLHSTHSSTAFRARTLGVYAFAVGVGMAVGMGVGAGLYACHPHLAFLLAGCVAVAAGLTFRVVLPADLSVVEEAGSASVRVWEHPLSMSCAWCQGFLESGLIALLPVYLRDVGYSDQEGGMLLGGAVLAGIGAQVPLAWLADRVGRRTVVYGCLVAGSVALWLMPHCLGPLALGACLMVAGASGTALYPLGLAVMSERLPTAARGRAGAWFLGVNCLASVIGPEISGRAMDQFGRPTLFLVGAVTLTAVLVVWSVQAMVVKPRSEVRRVEEAKAKAA